MIYIYIFGFSQTNLLDVQMYFVSKTLAEQAAWNFAKQNNLDFISIIPPLVVGPFLMSSMPPSLITALSPLTGTYSHTSRLRGGSFCHIVGTKVFSRSMVLLFLVEFHVNMFNYREWSSLFDYKARPICSLGWPLHGSYIFIWASQGRGKVHMLCMRCYHSWRCKIA